MATIRWLGGRVAARAEVKTLTLGGTWAAGDTVTLAVPSSGTGPSITVTVGATFTTAQIATEIAAAWNGTGGTLGTDYATTEWGGNVLQMAEITALAVGSTVVFTHDTKGVPFTLAVTRVTAASGTVSVGATTAATGPNDAGAAANWSGGLPANGDTVYIDQGSTDLLYGLDLSAVTLAALYIPQSFTGTVGLPAQNPAGYPEYRETYLKVGATVLVVGDGAGTGSGRLRIDTGSVQTALTVTNTGSAQDPDTPALVWKGTNASNELVQNGGSVGAAIYGGEAATLLTVTKTAGDLLTGDGVTLSAALTHRGGNWTVNSMVDGSLTVSGGAVTVEGTDKVDQLTMTGGTVSYLTSGTLGGNTSLSGTAVLDFSGATTAVNVINPIDLFGSAVLLDPNKRLGSVVVDLNGACTVAQVDLGENLRITRGAVA